VTRRSANGEFWPTEAGYVASVGSQLYLSAKPAARVELGVAGWKGKNANVAG
jgi:hypothetical protein